MTSRDISAEMSEHNTSVETLTQMTKLQYATARLTPAKPTRAAAEEGAARAPVNPSARCQTSAETRVSAVFMAMPLCNPPPWRGWGKGLWAGNSFFAQQHEWLPAQHSQALAVAATTGDGIAPPGNTWASWKTSPSKTVMKDFRVTTYLGRTNVINYSNNARQFSPQKKNFFNTGNPPPRQEAPHWPSAVADTPPQGTSFRVVSLTKLWSSGNGL